MKFLQQLKRTALLLSLPLFFSQPLTAQVQHEVLWPGITGSQLLDSVRVHYKPLVILNYTNARDEMYSFIDNTDGQIVCLYTGQTAAIDPNTTTPRADAGNANFNAEHIYPQSMGALSGNANSDLHHLRPTNANVNSSRGNLPFGFVATASTNRWWSGTSSQTTVPSGDLSIWSRTGSTNFQPRDAVQGDVARSMFYFFAMYTDEAIAANSNYFESQKEELLTFHRSDLVDEYEWNRTNRAAQFQEGKINPFILDTSLVARIFFVGETIGEPEPPAPGETMMARFNFSGTIDCNNQDNSSSSQVTGAVVSDMERVGIRCNAGGGIFNSAGWPEATSVDLGFYAGFTITADQGFELQSSSADELRFNIRRSTTGPQQMQVRYSVDGGAFTVLTNSAVPTNDNLITVSMPQVEDASTLEFRFYAWNASSANGTMRFNLIEAEFDAVASTESAMFTEIPSDVMLDQNYPNPFNPTTSIRFQLPVNDVVRLEVYDMLGKRVAVLADGAMTAGMHEVRFDAGSLSSGMYVYRLQTGNAVLTRKMTLLK
jgi:endonuclease I